MPFSNPKSLTRYQHFWIVVLPMLLCGLWSASLGKELSWDLVAYHYYNPYAILHHRWGQDYWPPTAIQSYLNPTMDFLHYFLIEYLPPFWTEFWLGAIHGLNFVLIFYISYLFTSRYEKKFPFVLTIILAMAGMYGPASFPEIGSFMGDNTVSIFILSAVLAMVIFVKEKPASLLPLIASGLLFGFGVGLKLTVGIFAFGFLTAFFAIGVRLKSLSMWLIAASVGFLISYGYWMIFLWQNYHNPFFPLFNGIFQSPYFINYSLHEVRSERSFLQTIFFPFYFAISGRTSDTFFADYFIDYSFAVAYMFLIATIVAVLAGKIKNRYETTLVWMLVFFVVSYIAWQACSINIRYMVALQMLSPLFIYLLLYCLTETAFIRWAIVFGSLLFIAIKMQPINRETLPQYGKNYFDVVFPNNLILPKEGMVITTVVNMSPVPGDLITYPVRPFVNLGLDKALNGGAHPAATIQNYLAVFFPPAWHFVGVTAVHREYAISPKAKSMIEKFVGPLYLLTTQRNMGSLIKFASALGLSARPDNCYPIKSDRMELQYMKPDKVVLCPAFKMKG